MTTDTTRAARLMPASAIRPRAYRRNWGPWHLDAAGRKLRMTAGGLTTEIDLDSCTTSAAGVLEAILATAAQTQGDHSAEASNTVSGMVHAFNDMLGFNSAIEPQGAWPSPEQIRTGIESLRGAA
ncbi:hypothetical protein [Dactylosporangium sp. CA-092794]|uniref:hypothetical protein n=1 Tax=Dactylosporangium sp. CA-092794 TaxID=3239929 RepID=UPI003D8A763D